MRIGRIHIPLRFPAKMRFRLTPRFPSMALFWRMCLIVLILLVLAQIGVLWLSGKGETQSALLENRRVLLALNLPEVPAPDAPAEEPAAPAEESAAPTDAAPQVEVPAAPVETGKTVEIVPEVEDEPLQPVAPSISAPQTVTPELTEKTDIGTLPRMGGDGSKPWKFYAKPYIHKGNKPMIAIIVSGLGPSKRMNELAIRLPEPMVLGFSPYTRDLPSWAASARLAGHELLLDLPIEPANYPAADPGPLGLLVSKDQQNNETRLKKVMASATGYMGFITPQDEVLTANNELFKSLLHILSGRGLMLVVGKPPHKSETREILDNGNTAHIVADTLIDEELTPVAIQARLSSLEQTAKSRGYAVGIAQAYPLTVEQLNEWAATLEENGYVLVPISFIIMQRFT